MGDYQLWRDPKYGTPLVLGEYEELVKCVLDALAAAFPHLCWDVTDPAELKRAGFVQAGWHSPNGALWSSTVAATRMRPTNGVPVWLAPERETTT